ncbi:MAG TPA: sensor histidine kinase [Thermoanaerobaculia bacterium]|nr:sensor histidine kinase [Thermoanaerobaculia bacterium]
MNQNEVWALEAHLGGELHRRSAELTRLWLDRLTARLDVQPRRVFPSDTLLNDMPEVLRAVSDYLCSGGDLGAEQVVRDEMTKLARLRREQGYDIDEILAEFEILGKILYDALREEARKFGRKVSPDYAVEVGERLYRALMVITTITATTFREEGFQDRRERARLLGSFGRDLAHELRNRLSTAETALHLLNQEDLDGPTRERVLLALRRTVKRIEGVADDVHALAIAQGSEETAQGRRLSLRALFEETVSELRGMAEERGVRIEAQEMVPDVQVDATRVELALINLIGNAVKYSDPAKEDRWVRVSVQRDDRYWRISVEDNGVGIPDGMQQRVFEQFVRAHPGVAEGSGLGLAIAREAVEQMGGRIWLESQTGVGTTFAFTVLDPPEARE